MELVNRTRYPAGLARMVIGRDDRIAASALVRVTYALQGGALTPLEEQPWIVSNAPWEGPHGLMAGDNVFYKGGVDVHLFGRAVAPGGRPLPNTDVEIRLGRDFQRTVRVFGPRVWHRRLGELVATPPRPFFEIPLTLGYAYGGKDEWDALEVPCLENPEGTGFFVTEENAVDRPLPCIEDPDELIQKWDDRPQPAGLGICPPASPLHAKRGLTVSPEGQARISALYFNAAFPRMVAPKLAARDVAWIGGVSRDGPVTFTLPRHAFALRLRFGAESHELPLEVDQIGVEIDLRRVFIAYRAPYRYIVYELQERGCELVELGFES